MTNKRTYFLTALLVSLVLFLLAELKTQPQLPAPSLPVITVQKNKVAAAEQTTVADAGQAKFNLTLIKHPGEDGKNTYSFHVINLETKEDQLLFEQTVSSPASYTAPFNSFSPDDLQLFIQITENNEPNYFVFNRDGSSFKDGQKYLNVRDYWNQGKGKYVMKEVSGWAGKDLLMVLTSKEDGSSGPSYWFVVSSRKFMQLAH